jgi:hypothetical protein
MVMDSSCPVELGRYRHFALTSTIPNGKKISVYLIKTVLNVSSVEGVEKEYTRRPPAS